MKKKLFVIMAIVAFCCSISLQAAPVSPTKALEIAHKIFSAQPATKSGTGALKIVWDGEFTDTPATKTSEHPAFYVISRDGGGFVIIAGDDNVTPVLGISDRNEFKTEGMPDNVRWWMERMKTYVRSISVQTSEVRERWADLTSTKSGKITGTVTSKVEKLTPEWAQGRTIGGRAVFNSKCPMLDGQYTKTGCVATAIGEVITYQSGQSGVTMPAAGTGTVGGYDVPAGRTAPAAYELGTVYDWENLRTLTDFSAIANAISAGKNDLIDNLDQLLADLGATSKARYGVSSTSAVTSYVVDNMAVHFGFNKAAYYASASDYTERQWIEKLKAELDLRPMIYNGRTDPNPSQGSGHAFVFDGYGKFGGADVFHVNFGWGGMDNGYYYHTNLDADSPYQYLYHCGGIFDFYPDPDSKHVYQLANDDDGLFISGAFSTNDWFILNYAYKNIGTTTYDGKLKAVLIDKDGTVKTDMDHFTGGGWDSGLSIDDMPVGWTYYEQLRIKIPESVTIGFGDRIVLYCTTNAEQSIWAPLTAVMNGAVINELPVMPAAFIRTADAYALNDWFDFALTNHIRHYAGTIWTFTDPTGNTVSKNQAEKEIQLTERGIWKIEAAVAETVGGAVIEKIVTYINVQ